MAEIIFVGNYKGGVGKTTTLFNLASRLSEKGKKSLLLDLDPQSSLSEICIKKYFENSSQLINLKPEETLNYIYDLSIHNIKLGSNLDLNFDLSKLIKKLDKGNENIHFIPSSLYYPNYQEPKSSIGSLFDDKTKLMGLDELAFNMNNSIEYLSILKRFINTIIKEESFDYIFIDCPPSNNFITKSAFLSSDYYLIPTILDGISTNGVVHYIKTVNNAYDKYCIGNSTSYLYNKHFFGGRPKLIGILSTMFKKTINYKQEEVNFNKMIKKEAPNMSYIEDVFFFETVINDYVEVARKMYLGEKSEDIKPTQTINDFESFANEYLSRMDKIKS